jgi:hypothetical protein
VAISPLAQYAGQSETDLSHPTIDGSIDFALGLPRAAIRRRRLIYPRFKRFQAPGVFPADFTMRNRAQGFDRIL